MEWLLSIAGGAALIAAIVIVIINRIKMRKIATELNDMLDRAIDGSFEETTYDESINSQLESKLADYLATSSLSAKRVEEEKDKIKSLISDISHQTKTPIANLMLYGELLAEEDGITPSMKEKIDAIVSQSEKLQFLVDALVKMSRLENGILKLTTVPTRCDDLMDQVCYDLTPKAEAKGLDLKFKYSDITVSCDPKWTLEALTNIVDNAIKYTDRGKITLTAKKYEMFSVISVKDTGRGMTEDEKTKIFGRFYRGEANAANEGVGIGLALAREIVTGEGGYIKVMSTPGKGSEFQIFLPSAILTDLS